MYYLEGRLWKKEPLLARSREHAYEQFDALFLQIHAQRHHRALDPDKSLLNQVKLVKLMSPEGKHLTSYRFHLQELEWRFRYKRR